MRKTKIKSVGIVCPYSFKVPGGVQNHVLGMAGWLKSNGIRVGILAPGYPPDGLLSSYHIDESDFTTGGKTVPVKVNGSVARINFGPRSAMRAKKWLDTGGWDIVHLHEPITPTLSLLTLWLTEKPVVGTFHSSSPVYRLLRVINEMLPKAVHRLDASIAVSSMAKVVATGHTGLDPVIVGNGLDINDYQLAPTKSRWRGGDHPRITFLGRYAEPRKGFNVLTAAKSLIQREYPDAEFLVIGRGPELEIEGMRFVGNVSDKQRNDWLTKTDVYIAPQTGRESFGIVLIEALACGAPVVASDLPAFVDVLTNEEGIAGHIFEAGNPAALAEAVLKSLGEPRDLRLSHGRDVAERYDWSVIGPQVVDIYKYALERRLAANARNKLFDRPKRRSDGLNESRGE